MMESHISKWVIEVGGLTILVSYYELQYITHPNCENKSWIVIEERNKSLIGRLRSLRNVFLFYFRARYIYTCSLKKSKNNKTRGNRITPAITQSLNNMSDKIAIGFIFALSAWLMIDAKGLLIDCRQQILCITYSYPLKRGCSFYSSRIKIQLDLKIETEEQEINF